jgi:hypothetical protein
MHRDGERILLSPKNVQDLAVMQTGFLGLVLKGQLVSADEKALMDRLTEQRQTGGNTEGLEFSVDEAQILIDSVDRKLKVDASLSVGPAALSQSPSIVLAGGALPRLQELVRPI